MSAEASKADWAASKGLVAERVTCSTMILVEVSGPVMISTSNSNG